MILYLIKYSRPDLANVVRELSKCMDGASLAAHRERKRVNKFVLFYNRIGDDWCNCNCNCQCFEDQFVFDIIRPWLQRN